MNLCFSKQPRRHIMKTLSNKVLLGLMSMKYVVYFWLINILAKNFGAPSEITGIWDQWFGIKKSINLVKMLVVTSLCLMQGWLRSLTKRALVIA